MYCLCAIPFSPSTKIISQIPTVKVCAIEFHTTYQTFMTITGIIVLPRHLWVSAGKEKATIRGIFLLAQTWYLNSQRWECSELGCECSAQISRWSNGEWVGDRHISEICLVGCGKKKEFWEEKEKNENEAKRRHLT